jgi:hypothetical protein
MSLRTTLRATAAEFGVQPVRGYHYHSLATHIGAHSATQTHVSCVFIISVQRAQKTPLFLINHPSLTHRHAMSWPVAPLPSSSTSACDHTLHMCMLLSAHCCTSLGARAYVHARTAPAIVSASRHSRSLCLAWRHLCSSHLSWLDCEWQTHVAARVSERALSLASMRGLRYKCSSHACMARGCNVALAQCVSPHFAVTNTAAPSKPPLPTSHRKTHTPCPVVANTAGCAPAHTTDSRGRRV